MTQLSDYYKKVVVQQLQKDQGYSNIMQVPKIVKVTLNMGVGSASADKKILQAAVAELTAIAGQKAVVCKSRKSIAGFKIRQGWPIGCKVTLRKKQMYDFLERLLFIALPRVRDFRGLNPKSFDKDGNFSMGIEEQIIFPEVDFDKIERLRGLDITVTTTARSPQEGLALLQAMNFPFKSAVA